MSKQHGHANRAGKKREKERKAIGLCKTALMRANRKKKKRGEREYRKREEADGNVD